ncbi:RNA-binding protein 10 [Geodia barretti]|uniref:RNA-binding protein 10 n=1 Tax=Geodia barretti TaxID=519541 RepID=A0AA35WK44_GEOBA|nr:RNA-binding protein 10 [Geodia barretti]
MLRNIRESVLKEDIAKALGDDVSFVRDIRLVTRKGSSSFAFVEFYDAKDSARWMEKIEADPLYLCGSRVDVDYSRAQRDQWRDRNNESRDWVCFKCNTVNFSRRRFCMTCDCTRTESDQFHEDVRSGKDTGPRDDNAPSNVLIMKGLDVNSTESSIRGALASLEGLQQPVDVRIIRDHITSASRGFCFLEFSSGEITSMALRKMLEQTPAFFVDGRRITVTYARGNNPKSTGTHNVANAAIAQAQWSMSLAPQLNSSLGQTQTSQQQGAQWHQAPVQYSQPPASTQQDQHLHLPFRLCLPRLVPWHPLLKKPLTFLPRTRTTQPLASTTTPPPDSTMIQRHSTTTIQRLATTAFLMLLNRPTSL